MAKLYEYSAGTLAAMIRSKVVSSREVIEAHLKRMDEIGDYVNAVTVVLRESALAAADQADKMPPMGPLHGVPFTIKENFDCLGSPTTMGIRVLAKAIPYLDAPVVARMKSAGAIPIGRTNLSEMALRLCTDNPLHGRTRNPWNPKLTVGGSSGGDAAAVATGMTPLGLGADMGGSLRIPAFCCGVAALKPTTGRIPYAASLEPQDHGMVLQAMLAPGPIARSVEDLKLCLTILSGRDIRDPRSVNAPLQGPLPDELTAALITEVPGLPLPQSTIAAIRRAGEHLAASGWTVAEVEAPELIRVNEIFGRLISTDYSILMPRMRPILSEPLYEHMMRICKWNDYTEVSNYWIHKERSRLMRIWSGFLSEFAVAIGPNWSCPVWPIDADLHPTKGLQLLEDTVKFVTPGNVLGLPSLALPMGIANDLPTGIQIYADLWREDLCLLAAELIEAKETMPLPLNPVLSNH